MCVYILDVSVMMLILMGNDCYSKNDVILLYLFSILSIGKKIRKIIFFNIYLIIYMRF